MQKTSYFNKVLFLFSFILLAILLGVFLQNLNYKSKIFAENDKQFASIEGPQSLSFTYNGSPADFTFVSNSGGEIFTQYYDFYDNLIEAPTNAGYYYVIVTCLETENFYETSEIYNFEISKAQYEGKNLNIKFNTTYEYNKTLDDYFEILINKYPLDSNYRFKEPETLVNAGENQKFEMIYNADPENFTDCEFYVTFNVNKATLHDSLFIFTSDDGIYKTEDDKLYFKYDGTPKNIYIDGSNDAVESINYINNSLTEVGEHIVSAQIILNENYNPINTKYCTVIIEKGVLNQTYVNQNLTHTYIDKVLTLSFKESFDVYIKIHTQDVYMQSLTLNAGTYSVYYKIVSENYEDFEGATTIVLEEDSLPTPPNNNQNDNQNNNQNNNQTENNNTNNNTITPEKTKYKTFLIIISICAGLVIIGTMFFVIIRKRRYHY